ncbi:protein SCO1/2 [Nocardiopsis mwathae]|uniref:Protein SCO1/2 n=1 Tax=Nocardiopsis mwathae TaxID=1472723 RepID=A0A7W9YJZ1_9ACTN|nr:SCO family protein [Nocardiopsis mwathae]MBB6172586.1 protein SCO1/2 [Nocardiopsis mwathae]
MRITIPLAGGLALAAALTACSGPSGRPGDDSPYNGTEIDGAFTLPSLTFTDNKGEEYDLRADSAGATTAVFFGFTNCPDICPTTMADMAQAVDMLDPAEQERFKVVFVTADPDRDDPELMDMWLSSFDPDFTGLSGTLEDTDAAAADLGISVSRPDDRDGDYQVGHGSQTLVFSPEGESELMWNYGTEPDDIAADLKLLLKEDDAR